MTGTIELRNPIKVNNELVKELTYDTESITIDQFQEAERRAAFTAGIKEMVIVDFLESNGTFQQYIGMFAIINVNPEVDIEDLKRLKGFDTMQLYRIGRNFIRGSAQENEPEMDSVDEILGDSAETTPEPTSATLENLEE